MTVTKPAKTKTDTPSDDGVSKVGKTSGEGGSVDPVKSEFVSDEYKATEKDLEEVQAGLRKLGIDSLVKQAQAVDKDSNGKIN